MKFKWLIILTPMIVNVIVSWFNLTEATLFMSCQTFQHQP
jgi:hypothetical protein